MPFVLIGFIILVFSFIIALASLIREQSRRSDFEAFEADLSLVGEEEVQKPVSEFPKDDEAVELVSAQTDETQIGGSNLAEYAPFPWEDPSLDLEPSKDNERIAGSEGLSARLPIIEQEHSNLEGEVSLSDLKKNFN